MKKLAVSLVLVAGVLGLLFGSSFAKEKSGTTRYLVISPHTPEECMKALDSVSAMGSNTLKMYDWGCKNNDHTGYFVINAKTEQEALANVPTDLRDRAKAMKLNKFSMDEIKAFHQQMDHGATTTKN